MGDPARAIAARLRYMGAGLLALLNSYAFRIARRDFPHLLVEDPRKAYEAVLAYTRGDRGKARYILLNILVGLVGSPAEAEAALEALERGDPEPLKELLSRLGGMKKRSRLL